MKRNRVTVYFVRVLMVLCLVLGCMISSDTAKAKWVKVGKNYRYTTNASGTKYYKNRWVKIKGKYYYFNKKGYRKTGWLTYNGKKYYLNKKGVRVTGFQTISNKKYYFSKKGVMITGWVKSKNQYYYMNAKGIMQTGLQSINGYIYYFDAEGKRVSDGNIVIGNMTYYFSNNGTLQYTGSEPEKAAKYINVQRIIMGYEPLSYYGESNLANAASVRAKELSIIKSHTRPDGTSYSTVLSKDYPINIYWSGECILWGNTKTGDVVAANWLSNNNASVLMQKEANGISIASYKDKKGYQYWAAIVVQIK